MSLLPILAFLGSFLLLFLVPIVLLLQGKGYFFALMNPIVPGLSPLDCLGLLLWCPNLLFSCVSRLCICHVFLGELPTLVPVSSTLKWNWPCLLTIPHSQKAKVLYHDLALDDTPCIVTLLCLSNE